MFERSIPFRASISPESPAFWLGGREVGYAQFERDINAVAILLARRDLAPRSTVLIDVENHGLRWIVALALERLGHAFVFSSPGGADAAAISLVAPDLVFTTRQGVSDRTSADVLLADRDWIQSIAEAPVHAPAPRSPAAPDDVIALVLSSGTTGQRKTVPFFRRMFDERLDALTAWFGATTRHMTTMGPDTVSGLSLPMVAWRMGATAVFGGPLSPQLVEAARPDAILLSPTQLHAALAAPELFTTGPKVRLCVAGSALPPALIRAVEARGGAELQNGYGSTEVGWAAYGPARLMQGRPAVVGYAPPSAEIRIIGPDGREAAPGESGEICIRAMGMASEYRDDPETTAAHFKDGWFYPGDVGALSAGGLLTVEGRTDDILNIGGVKVSANAIENTARDLDAVSDAGAAALRMTSGQDRLFCAVVAVAGAELADISRRLTETHRVPVAVVALERIPRNGMDKIQRDALKAMLAEVLQARRQ